MIVGQIGRAGDRQDSATISGNQRSTRRVGREHFRVAVLAIGDRDRHRCQHRAVGIGDRGVRGGDGDRRAPRRICCGAAGSRDGGGQIDHGRGIQLRDDLGGRVGGSQEEPQEADTRAQPAFAEVVLAAAFARGEHDLERVFANRPPGRAADGSQAVDAVEELGRPVLLDAVSSRGKARERVRSVRAGQNGRLPGHLRPGAVGPLFQQPDRHARKAQVRLAVGSRPQTVVVVVDVDETGETRGADRQRRRVGGGAEGRRAAVGGRGDLAAARPSGRIPGAVRDRGRLAARCARRVAERGAGGQEQRRAGRDRPHGRKGRAVRRVGPGPAAGRSGQSDTAHDGAGVRIGNRRRSRAAVDECREGDRLGGAWSRGSQRGAGAGEHRRVVNAGHGQGSGVGCGAESRGAAAGGGVHLGAAYAAGRIPGAVRDPGCFAILAVGRVAERGAGRNEQRRVGRHRADCCVGRAVGRKGPGSIAGGGGQGDAAEHGVSIGIGNRRRSGPAVDKRREGDRFGGVFVGGSQ